MSLDHPTDPAGQAHAERWAPQMKAQGGLVLGTIILRPGGSVDIAYGPALEDAPPSTRGGLLLALGSYMSLTAPKVIEEADEIADQLAGQGD